MKFPADQAARTRAVESPVNLAVTAGAGTGKTTLLVARIVHLVQDRNVPVEAVLALTFTEKAANEMRQRLREKLGALGKAEGLDRAEIGTIHSFCAHVLRQFPVEAGVAPDFEVDEGAEFRRRFEEAWPAWLDRELGPGARRPRVWEELLSKVRLRDLEELARELCSFAIPDERDGGPAELARRVRELSLAAPEVAAALSGKEPPKKASPKDPAAAKAAKKLAEDVARIDEALVGRAVGLVDEFAREFRAATLRAGWVSFDGLLRLTHELLRDPKFPGVLRTLRARYRHILVDEFQDTDPVQGEIIERLAEGDDGRLVPGRLFLVGDAKQSIYSFRGADVVAYRRLHRRIVGEGGEEAVLRTNFRSHGEILGFVNASFSRLIVENGDLQPRYEPIEAPVGREARWPGPTIEAVVVEGASADESREMEAAEIARWILAHPEVPHRDTAILFRSLVDVGVYLEALRADGIPYVVEGEKYFFGTSEVVDFVNLLRAVANPHDRVALAGVLRSPYGGVSDPKLYELKKKLDYRTEAEVPVFQRLRRWNAESGRLGVTELIDRIFDEGWALEIAQSGYHGEQAAANLLKLRRMAEEREARGGCTLREFLDVAARAVRDLEEEGESPLADESLDAVRILSIHRSKGLEFPAVILPDLHRGQANARAPVAAYDRPSRTLGVRLGDVMNAGGAALAHLERERRREEARRLLYVAVTRAEDRLVLLGSGDGRGETFLSMLLPDLEKRAALQRKPYERPPHRPAPAPAGQERPDWAAFAAAWKRREAQSAAVERFTSPTKLERAATALSAEDGPSAAADLGTACHRVLEQLDFKRPSGPPGTPPEAAELLEGFFKSKAFAELSESELLARELPFVLERGGRIVQGVIDVVYRSGGKLYVADWKTDKILEPGDYRVSGEIYAEAVKRALGEAPRFRLIDLRKGRVVDV